MRILGFSSGSHDASAAAFEDYRLIAAVQEERLRREKGWGDDVPWLAIDEVLRIAGWSRFDVDAIATIRGIFPLHYFRFPLTRDLYYTARKSSAASAQPRHLARLHCERHVGRRHAVPHRPVPRENAFRPDTKLYLRQSPRSACAGGAVSHRLGRCADLHVGRNRRQRQLFDPLAHDGRLDCLTATTSLLAKRARHARQPRPPPTASRPGLRLPHVAPRGQADRALGARRADTGGRLRAAFPRLARRPDRSRFQEHAHHGREDRSRCARATAARTSPRRSRRSPKMSSCRRVRHWIDATGARRLGDRRRTVRQCADQPPARRELPLDEIFIFPAMGDDGLAVGIGAELPAGARRACRPGSAQRRRLDNVYLGRDYDDAIDRCLGAAAACGGSRRAGRAGDRIDLRRQGRRHLSGRMEYGPRALGARSIIASPADAGINDSLNERLDRSEFMPFAPVVLEEDAERGVRDHAGQSLRGALHDHHLRGASRNGGHAFQRWSMSTAPRGRRSCATATIRSTPTSCGGSAPPPACRC